MSMRQHLLRSLPKIIAHRGASGEAPENTLAAIRIAHQHGARWIEVDAKISADRLGFLLHDASVDRTTNGSGDAAAMTWSELNQLDAGGYHSAEFAGEPLPSLRAMVDLLAELEMGANIEIKPSPGLDAETAESVVREILQLWPDALPAPLFSSFSPVALNAVRRVASHWPRGLLVNHWNEKAEGLLAELDCHSLHINHIDLDLAVLADLRSCDIPVLCFTVNNKDRAVELIQGGAVSIITDWPKEIAAAINSA